MKKFNILLALLTLSLVSFSQPEFSWAVQNGASSGAEGKALVTDLLGNSYVLGTVSGWPQSPISFGANVLTKFGGQDILLVKFDADGNYVWGKTFGNTGDDQGVGIAMDQEGNVVICGSYAGTVSFVHQSVTSVGSSSNVFVAKFDADGNYQWNQTYGGTAADSPTSITTDSDGKIYLTGGYRKVAGFGTITLTAADEWYDDLFVAGLDNNGAVLWAKNSNTTYNNTYSIHAASDGLIYVGGKLANNTQIDGITHPGGMALLAFNKSTGALQSALSIVALSFGTWADQIVDISTDVAGNLFVTGKFSGTKKFGETTLNQSNDGFFVAKLGNATAETCVVKAGLNQFRAYPNPFSDKVQIKFQSHANTNARIDIYDATGRKLKTLLNQYVSANQENEVEFIPEPGT